MTAEAPRERHAHPELSAAVVDLHLGDGTGTVLCRRLRQRGVPFVVYTGYPPMLISDEWPDVPVISKPAQPDTIVSALMGVLHLGAISTRHGSRLPDQAGGGPLGGTSSA